MKNVRFISLLLAILMFAGPLFTACSSSLSEPISQTTTETEKEEGGKGNQFESLRQPETEENKTTATEDKVIWTKPEEDGEFNVLLIGSSFAYRFPGELCGMAEAMGVDIRVCHAYYSGVTLKTQWNWIRAEEGEYKLLSHGSLPVKGGVGTQKRLVDILPLYNWDVISVHQTPMGFRSGDYETSLKGCSYAKNIYQFLRERCPDARFMWYQIWAINVGYTVDDPTNCIPTREKQLAMHKASHDVAREMMKQHNVDLVPAGDAWELIRSTTKLGDTLTGRDGDEYGDKLHDGDTGGGQYLNACVWYEVLFQKSCLGNTWRPEKYDIDEAKIPLLQKAAHQAVADAWGSDYAK